MSLAQHELYMRRCLFLARLGMGHVTPNPMVGAVLVYEGRIIGEGFHRKYGEAHAEVDCINNVAEEDKHLIPAATLYVSLEPCNHYGKTPPCTELILKHGIRHVVVGTVDLTDKVNGSGIARLEAAGVQVTKNVLVDECRWLNRRFFTFYLKQRPYIILKWAQTADGFIAAADKQPVPISNDITNRLVHKWRTEEAGIMVGTNTARHDDPRLTARLWPGNDPVRIIPDRYLRLPQGLHVFDKSITTLVLTERFEDASEQEPLRYLAVDPWEMDALLTYLYMKGIQSVMVEGGSLLINSFVKENLWDEARKITNTKMYLQDGVPAPTIQNFRLLQQENIGNDLISYFEHKTDNQQF